MTTTWQFWAFLSAIFAALTAIFAKIGISGLPSDYVTLLRTCVVLAVLAWLSLRAARERRPVAHRLSIMTGVATIVLSIPLIPIFGMARPTFTTEAIRRNSRGTCGWWTLSVNRECHPVSL